MTTDQTWRDTSDWDRMKQQRKRYDNWTCQNPDCGQRGGELHAHHITPVSEGGNIFDHDNLTTLCVECHRKAHADDDYAHLLDF